MSLDKRRLLEALQARVEADLEALVRRQQDTARGATHEESRAEHAKDTRATEQSYLARGLAERVEALRDARARLARFAPRDFDGTTPAAVGALVTWQDLETGARETCWLVPVAGGIDLESGPDGRRVRTLTPAAPLGRSLLGLEPGDEGALRTPAGTRRFEILAVE